MKIFLSLILLATQAFAGNAALVENARLAAKVAGSGHYIDCPSEEAVIEHYQSILKTHAVYGTPDATRFSNLFEVNRHYENILNSFTEPNGKALVSNRFDKVTTDQILNGEKIFGHAVEPQVGDIILNFRFVHPDHVGSFYSKRGMIHTRMVVETNKPAGRIRVLDGGWQSYSTLTQMDAQSLLLRPRLDLLGCENSDLKNCPGIEEKIKALARKIKPLGYDNQLIDDLQGFRQALNESLAAGSSNLEAAQLAQEKSAAGSYYPFGKDPAVDADNSNQNKYCSEGATDIFSFLGFYQNGEFAFDLISNFSASGELPSWKTYLNALKGFNGDQGVTRLIHENYYFYFSLIDQLWEDGIMPRTTEGRYQFKTEFENYKNQLLYRESIDAFSEDLLLADLEKINSQLDAEENAELLAKIEKVQSGLSEMFSQVSTQLPVKTLAQLIQAVFFQQKAYGPHHFFENANYFELKAIYYNPLNKMGLTGSYWWDDSHQAKWAADTRPNSSNTMYRIKEGLEAEKCVIADKVD